MEVTTEDNPVRFLLAAAKPLNEPVRVGTTLTMLLLGILLIVICISRWLDMARLL